MILKNTIRDNHRRLLGSAKRGSGRELSATDLFARDELGLSQVATHQGPTVSGELVAVEEWNQLQRSLARLSDEQRRVIELRHFDELSFAEIAERMSKSDPAVRMLWVRALRNLQQTSQDT